MPDSARLRQVKERVQAALVQQEGGGVDGGNGGIRGTQRSRSRNKAL